MAFPTTGVLDSGVRSNENPLSDGGKWTNAALPEAAYNLELLSNVIKCVTASQYGGAHRNDADYGPDTEVYATVTAKDTTNGNDFGLYARLQQIGAGTTDGYMLNITTAAGVDVWSFNRYTDGAWVSFIGAKFTQEIAAGDAVGMSIVGTTLTAWYKPVGGVWSRLAERDDATYPGAGKLGLVAYSTAWEFNNYGGGTVIEGKIRRPLAHSQRMG